MDTTTIDQILTRNTITAPFYAGCFPADKLPSCKSYPCSMVVNLDDSSKPGSHWVAIFIQSPTLAFYFDSYGLKPSGKIKKYLSKFAYLTMQKAVIQSIVSDVCGYYVIMFIYLCSMGSSFEQINNLFANTKNPDKFVVYFVEKYIK